MTEIPEGYVPIAGSDLAPANGFSRSMEWADNERQMDVTVRVRRRHDAPRLVDPAGLPVAERTFLSRADLASRYGADPADVEVVAAFARECGLTVSGEITSQDTVARRCITLSGTRSELSASFGVDIGSYAKGGRARETYLGREGPIYVPARLAPIVEGVFGLDQRPIGSRRTGIGAAAASSLPKPRDIAGRYRFPSVSARGQTIALLQFGGGYYPSDIDAYFAAVSARRPQIIEVSVDGMTNNPGVFVRYDCEVTLDIDIAGSVAEEAGIVVYFAPHTERGWINAVSACVHDARNAPSVISISWGAAELQHRSTLQWTASGMAALHDVFREAAAMGITVLAASGDEGSGCSIGDRRAHVNYPASDPRVVACGGTTMSDVAQVPGDEAPWQSGGGGISEVFSRPPWQPPDMPVSVNDGASNRGIPDIAGYAYPGYEFIYRGERFTASGTSLTAPLYAALIAKLNVTLGRRVGNLLPNLYALAGTWAYRDLVNGPGNASGGAPGYYPSSGWDACSGLGVVDGEELRARL